MTEQEEIQFIGQAREHGKFVFIKRYESQRINRFLVTVGNISIPLDITDETWNNLDLARAERNS